MYQAGGAYETPNGQPMLVVGCNAPGPEKYWVGCHRHVWKWHALKVSEGRPESNSAVRNIETKREAWEKKTKKKKTNQEKFGHRS